VAAALDRDDPGWRWADIRAKLPKLPPEENSAPLVKAAAELLPKGWPEVPAVARKDEAGNVVELRLSADEKLWARIQALEPNLALPEDLAMELRRELEALQSAVLVARALTDGPTSGEALLDSTTDAFSTLLPHIQPTRNLSMLLALDAAIRSHDRRGTEAIESCQSGLAVGRSLGTLPVPISMLVRDAIALDVAQAAERALATTEPDREALVRLQLLFRREAAELEPLLLATARGERAMTFELIERSARGEVSIEALGMREPRVRPQSTRERLLGWLFLTPPRATAWRSTPKP
jgi:hypothetical protein